MTDGEGQSAVEDDTSRVVADPQQQEDEGIGDQDKEINIYDSSSSSEDEICFDENNRIISNKDLEKSHTEESSPDGNVQMRTKNPPVGGIKLPILSLNGGSVKLKRTSSTSAAMMSSGAQDEGSGEEPTTGGYKATSTVTNRISYTSGPDAASILSQSPLFRKKLSPEEEGAPQTPTPIIGGEAVTPPGSLNNRLAALQKNGEEGWKMRVHKEDHKKKSRPVSLMSRMSALETSGMGWRCRVTQSDAKTFTVTHRIAQSASASNVNVSSSTSSSNVTSSSTSNNVSPPGLLLNGGEVPSPPKLRSPLPRVFKSKTGGHLPPPGPPPPSSPSLAARVEYRRTISSPINNNSESLGERVEIFAVADEKFDAFFGGSMKEVEGEGEEVVLGDLDSIFGDSSTVTTLAVKRRSVRKHSRQKRASHNPLKPVEGVEVAEEYTQTRLHVGERQIKEDRLKELSKNSSFALEALAGLASKENFSSVLLRPVSTQDLRELPPYTHPMLIRVKGRRHAQGRLVPPRVASVNTGDDFVLVTPKQVYHYKGEFANVIERARASEISSFIVQQRDLGVEGAAPPPIEISENIRGIRRSDFYEILGGDVDSAPSPLSVGGCDEQIESCLDRTNKIYTLDAGGDALEPHPTAWAMAPSVDILQPDTVLVMDFGSEVYSWCGKTSPPASRKAAVRLARELWGSGYDYTHCGWCPVGEELTGDRPSWGILGKITQNLETVLFRDKFQDWPDEAQQNRIKESEAEALSRPPPAAPLESLAPAPLREGTPPEPCLNLEMATLGRGKTYYDTEERRQFIVTTKDYKVWHIGDADKSLLSANACHLHAGESYVVRWYYRLTTTGRTLKGAPSKHNITGRDRIAYFFWQGASSSISNKGVSALMTVELDQERGPHVRVDGGKEPPAFLNIFDGSLVVHSGRREASRPSPRMYLVRGEAGTEAHLLEVEPSRRHLRSRGCLVVVDSDGCEVHLWVGAKASPVYREIGAEASQKLCSSSSEVFGWTSAAPLHEHHEGGEPSSFWALLPCEDSNNNNADTGSECANSHLSDALRREYRHLSLLSGEGTAEEETTETLEAPRLWHLEATHLAFEAEEIASSYWLPGATNALPFWQKDLYSVDQPALFLIDSGPRVWLWQGWWPPVHHSTLEDQATTGSALLRFNFKRKAALKTAIDYASEKNVATPLLAYAGLEPASFVNLFPHWEERPEVALAQQDSRHTRHATAATALAALSRSSYSLRELVAHPPPEGVDPARLEDYLSNDDFEKVLGYSREEFSNLASWKQLDLKKKAELW